jgi:mRNA interferase RelE/StbE
LRFRLDIDAAAEKDLDRLPDDVSRRIFQRILTLARQPRPPGCLKLRQRDNKWRIRVETYRVIYEIDDARRIVTVLRVRHRKDAYR